MGETGQMWQVGTGGDVSSPGGDAAIVLPSGQSVTLIETLANSQGPQGLVVRFRFLAPEINRDTGSVDFQAAADDIAWLCENYALARVTGTTPMPSQIIISMEDRPVPFGEADPEAVQYFEAFRIEDGVCIWEIF
ncbi:DUF6497 family protein [Tabrizicola sp.]|uniref:DUF6497 family protein n=1 Tax=Tabrizicola sp. TaxID=2005166 RepID=UPI003D27083D